MLLTGDSTADAVYLVTRNVIDLHQAVADGLNH
jgi:hypothetical protein